MTATATQSPFPQYFNTDGKPLSNGYLYFGVANQNPETNPIPVYWDAAATQPAAQPIRTKNGYPVRDGTIANVFVDSAYSLIIKTSKGVTVSYVRDSSEFDLATYLKGQNGAAQIGFIQDGSGAVLRTVQSKLREYKSVTDYGAVGDGVTDDTAAIQNALNAGLHVHFGDQTKNYRITGTLVVRNYAMLDGRGARIFQESRQTPPFDVRNTTGVTITGLRMTGYTAVDVNAGSFVVGVPYTIRTPGTTNFVALGAADNNVGTYFIATGAGTGTGVASTFYNRPSSMDIGIRADGATNLLVYDNEFYGFNYSPLMVNSAGTNIRFERNIVRGPGLSTLTTNYRNCTGVTIVQTNGVYIVGNTFSETSQALIVGEGSANVTVANNIVKNTRVEHGMYLDTGLVNTTVIGNIVNDAALNGIKFQWYDSYGVRPKNLTIANNIVNNAAGGDGIIALNVATAPVANVISITNANPGVIEFDAAHGCSAGDIIELSAIGGMTPLIGSFYVDSVVSATKITVRTSGAVIDTTNTTAYPPYTSGGTLQKPLYLEGLTISGNVINGCLQDGISTRYVNGASITGNTVKGCGRFGYGQIVGLNIDFDGNNITDTQYNGIFADVPLAPCSFSDNTLINVGAAGDDTNGGSSGIYVQGDGGGSVVENNVKGERTQTKMLYGIQLASGDKSQWVIRDNVIVDAESAIISLHSLNTTPLRLFGRNIGTTGTGPDALVGLPSALPARGNPDEWYFGTAAPVSGTWAQGKTVWALYPALGTPLGWKCVVSGTPGTWAPFGGLQSANPWGVTNPVSTRSINVSTATANDCARVIGTLIADLQSAGILK